MPKSSISSLVARAKVSFMRVASKLGEIIGLGRFFIRENTNYVMVIDAFGVRLQIESSASYIKRG